MRGIERLLDDLQVPFCVASSSDRERLSFSLEITGLAGRFGNRVYSADQVRHGKPAPDLFLHAAAAMNAEPSRTVVIEDSVSGVRAGKAAGMTVWGFLGGSHYAERNGRSALADAGADRLFCDMAHFHPS
jgi:HAD superfamily hydrolase (TIGR01509 family)